MLCFNWNLCNLVFEVNNWISKESLGAIKNLYKGWKESIRGYQTSRWQLCSGIPEIHEQRVLSECLDVVE
ncbi:unnamed protein product [Moneuplotes crassus]|uniref:Uncharacterized protein n=1 Tax=Euplotes crassus TaxID=5936 RepID=A0AAD1UPV7_EUPCR|nr:unnamed protein product [Moneuplotes crassus]